MLPQRARAASARGGRPPRRLFRALWRRMLESGCKTVGECTEKYIITCDDDEKCNEMSYRLPYDDMHLTYHGFGFLQVLRKIAAAGKEFVAYGCASPMRGRSIRVYA